MGRQRAPRPDGLGRLPALALRRQNRRSALAERYLHVFHLIDHLYMSGVLPRGIEDVRGLVTDGQREEYDVHGMIFDEASLSEALKEVGFSEFE